MPAKENEAFAFFEELFGLLGVVASDDPVDIGLFVQFGVFAAGDEKILERADGGFFELFFREVKIGEGEVAQRPFPEGGEEAVAERAESSAGGMDGRVRKIGEGEGEGADEEVLHN